MDPRGTGRSDSIPDDYRLRDHAEDIRAVAEVIGGAPVVLVGLSMAGRIGVHLATTYPRLVQKFIAVAMLPSNIITEFPVPVDPEMRAFYLRVLELLKADAYDEAMTLFWSRMVSEPGDRDLVAAFHANSRGLAPAVFRTFFLLPDPGRNTLPLLPALRIPTLVLHGDADRIVPVEVAPYIAAQVPGAQLYIFKNRGHALYATATAEFVQVAQHFIRHGRPA